MKREKSFVEAFSNILIQQHLLQKQDTHLLAQEFTNRDDVTYEEFLLEEGLVEKEDLLKAMSQYYGVPAVDVLGEFFEHYLIHLFPKDVMLRWGFIPHYRDNDTLFVIAANPTHPDLPWIINQYIFHDISFRVGFLSDIRETIEEFADTSITPNPNDIENQRMERSQLDVHPSDELKQNENREIPEDVEQTIDDYESH